MVAARRKDTRRTMRMEQAPLGVGQGWTSCLRKYTPNPPECQPGNSPPFQAILQRRRATPEQRGSPSRDAPADEASTSGSGGSLQNPAILRPPVSPDGNKMTLGEQYEKRRGGMSGKCQKIIIDMSASSGALGRKRWMPSRKAWCGDR